MGEMIDMPRVKLGSQGLEVSKLGYGCMGLTGIYNSPVTEEDGIAVLKYAFRRGITFFDTSNVYGADHANEILVGKSWHTIAQCVHDILEDYPQLRLTHGRKVLEVRPVINWNKGKAVEFLLDSLGLSDSEDVLPIYIGDDTTDEDAFKALKQLPRGKIELATKFGIVKFTPPNIEVKGNPEYVRSCCEASLRRLGVDYIDLYYVHRIDTSVPIEETMGELKKLVEEGKIKYIGLSEASPNTIRRAHAVHPISALQMEYSLFTRDIEEEIIPVCRELGIGIVPYAPTVLVGFLAGRQWWRLYLLQIVTWNLILGFQDRTWSRTKSFVLVSNR